MASKILKIIGGKKAQPFIIGGVVIIGGIILFMMLRGGASSGSSAGAAAGPSDALQAAQLQASTQIALGQQSADVANAQTAGQIQTFMYGKDTDLALGQLQTQLALYTTGQQATVALAQTDAQKQIALSNNAVQQYGIQQQFNYMNNQTNAQFDYLALQNSNQTSIDLSRIGSDERTAQNNAKAAKQIATTNAVGNIVGGIIGMFSDERLKKNIRWTGDAMERNPMNRGFVEIGKYDWDWKAGSGMTGAGHGAIAQQLMIVKPEAITRYRRGRMMVNYEAVA